jgi:hypothetical protein
MKQRRGIYHAAQERKAITWSRRQGCAKKRQADRKSRNGAIDERSLSKA